MDIHELAYFTASPVAHVVAYRDRQRTLRIAADNRATLRIIARRSR